jgi:AraC-like DNA-binding protein
VKYREFDPLPALADVIDCLWTLEGHASSDSAAEPILPDGRPELIVHLGQPFERLTADGQAEFQPSVIFAGQLPEQLLLRPRGHVAVFGVRFHPHGAAAILPAPQYELAGVPQPLDALHRPLARALEDVRQLDDLNEAIVTVQAMLIRAIDPARIDRRVAFAVKTIAGTSGRLSVDALARATGLTRRHLERRFLATVGITPKRLARLTRFQRALRLLLHPRSTRSGTETAAACGYADQAHFIRDFRLLAGCSPGEHLMRQGELTGFFSGNERRQRLTPNS